MFNLFQNILSANSAGKALGNTGAFSVVQNPIAPVAQAIRQSDAVKKTAPIVQQAGRELSTVTQPLMQGIKSTVQPIKREYDYTKKIGQTKAKYATELMSLGLTAQAMDEMGLSDEEKQAVKAIYDQVGATIPGLEEQAMEQQAMAQEQTRQGEDLGFFGSIKEGAIGVGQAGMYIPEAAGFIGSMIPGAMGEIAGYAGSALGVERENNPIYTSLKQGQLATQRAGQMVTGAGVDNLNLTEKQKTARRTGAMLALTAPVPVKGLGLVKGTGLGATALRGGLAGAQGTAAYGAASEGRIDPVDVAIGAAGGAVLGPVLEKAIIPTVAGIANKTTKYGKALVKGGVEGAKKSIVRDIKGVGQTIGEKYKGIRQYLAGLEPKEVTAIQKTSAQEFDNILNRAKEAVGPNADYTQTPYYIFDEAADALSKIDDNLAMRQSERLAILDEAPIATIDANDARMTLKSALRSMNVEDIRIVDGKPEIIPVKGREALIDLSNPADVKALQKLNEILDGDVSPVQTMDRIKKLQEWAYENKSTIGVKGTSERMNGLIKRVQGSLNATFKKQLPPEYAKVLDSMSEDIQLADDMRRLFGIDEMGNQVGNRGELLMKRILNGTTTGGEARKLAERIRERYGIDFIRQARLRQLAMDLVGDERGKTFFQAAQEGKSGIIDTAVQKTIGAIVNKEGVARSLAKGKGDTIIKQKPLYTPNAFRKGMAEEARMPKALPAPSGKATGAKNVRVNQPKEAPAIKSDITSKSKIVRPGTKTKLQASVEKQLLDAKKRESFIRETKQDIASATNAARYGGTGNSRIEQAINSKLGAKKLTIEEARQIVEDIIEDVTNNGNRSVYLYTEKPKLLEYLESLYDNKVVSKLLNEEDLFYTPKPIVSPKKPVEKTVKPNQSTNAKQQVSNANASDTIPEGYFRNILGEIVKKPSNKKGGFIKIPEIGKKNIIKPPDSAIKEIQDIKKVAKNIFGDEFRLFQAKRPISQIEEIARDDYWKKPEVIKKVNQIKERILRGEELPPLIADRRVGDKVTPYSIVDGLHRMKALEELGYKGDVEIIYPLGKKISSDSLFYEEPYMQKIDLGKITQKPKPLSPQKTVKPLTPKKQSATMSDKETKKLIEEARKYKSAEEFIKAQGEPVYHGTYAYKTSDIQKVKGIVQKIYEKNGGKYEQSDLNKIGMDAEFILKNKDKLKVKDENLIEQLQDELSSKIKKPSVSFAGKSIKDVTDNSLGIYTTPDIDFARRFTYDIDVNPYSGKKTVIQPRDGYIIEMYYKGNTLDLTKGASKYLDVLSEIIGKDKEFISSKLKTKEGTKIIQKLLATKRDLLKEKGFNAVKNYAWDDTVKKYKEELAILDDNSIKTKEELNKIWEQANKKTN